MVTSVCVIQRLQLFNLPVLLRSLIFRLFTEITPAAKSHVTPLLVSQSRPSIISSIFGVTKNVAGRGCPSITTGSDNVPSVVRLVLLTARSGKGAGKRFRVSASCDGSKLTSAPLSSRQFCNCPLMRAGMYAAECAFTGFVCTEGTVGPAPATVLCRFPSFVEDIHCASGLLPYNADTGQEAV